MTSTAAMRTRQVDACILCGTAGRMLHQGLHDRLFGIPGTWSIRKCGAPDCGLLWLDPAPVEDDVGKPYATYYTHDASGDARRSLKAIFVRNIVRCLNLLLLPLGIRRKRFLASTIYLAGMKPGRLLDVGCGDGAVLDRLRGMGWQVEGVEVDPKAVESARRDLGLSVRQGTLAQAAFAADTFDAVVLSHVIEHVHDPVALLRECRRILNRGGCLVLVTPNAASFGHAWFGEHWLHLDPPRHLHLFTLSALRRAALAAGISRVEAFTTPAQAESTFIDSEAIRTGARFRLSESPAAVSTACRAFLFQARALLCSLRRGDTGEEIVLKASK
ncbi:MAG: class I SAM-dependent methyltransferase [Betaproteobacteria bacterium]|nr:MAG: class I SAM-dependent methyltransferase [Betaproteobacteria bacterium]